MSELKKMEQQLIKAGALKGMLQIDWVRERAIKNYEATTSRKDGTNWFQQEAFAMMSIFAEKPELLKAEPLSIVGALVKAGTLGLRISDGHIDLIKRGNILKAEANYKGHREQLRRMDTIKEIGEAQIVYVGDEFIEDKLNSRILKHEGKMPKAITMDVIQAAYVRVTFNGGIIKDVVVYHDELIKARSKSPAWKGQASESSPWTEWPSEMCKKVAIHRANKNYYRRPDHEVIINPVEGELDDTLTVPHVVQAEEVPEWQAEPTEEATSKKPKDKPVPEEAKVVAKTDSDLDKFLQDN